MARNIVNTISYIIRGENQLGPVTQGAVADLQEVEQQAQKTKGSFQQLAGAYNAMIVAKKAVGLISAMVKPAIDVQRATTHMAIATGMNADETDRMSRAAIAAQAVTPFTAVEAIKAGTSLKMVLQDVNATAAALTPTLELAAVYMDKDITRATKAASTIVKGFNVSAADLPKALDQWIVASRTAGIPINEMDKGLTDLSIAAQLSGSSFEEMMPIYGLAVSRFRNAARAGMGLRTAMAALVHPTKQQEEALARLNVELPKVGEKVDVQGVFLQLADSFEANKNNMVGFKGALAAAFGMRAIGPVVGALTALTSSGKSARDVLADFARPVSAVGGGLEAMKEADLKTLGRQLDVLSSNFLAMGAAIMQGVLPILTPVVAFFGKIVEGIRWVFTELGPFSWILRNSVGALAVGGGLYVVVLAGLAAIKGAIAMVSLAMGWLATQTGGATTSLLGFAAASQAVGVAGGGVAGGAAKAGLLARAGGWLKTGAGDIATAAAMGGGGVRGAASAVGMGGAALGGRIWGGIKGAGGLLLRGGRMLLSVAGKFIWVIGLIEGIYYAAKLATWAYDQYKEASKRFEYLQNRDAKIKEYEAKVNALNRAETERQIRAFEAARHAREVENINSWFYASKELNNAAFGLSQAKLEKTATLSRGAAGFFEGGMAKLPEQAQAKYSEYFDKLNLIFEKANKGELVSPGQVDEAQASLRMMATALSYTDIPAKDVAKNFKSLQEGLGGLRFGSKERHDVGVAMGIIKPQEEVAKQKKLADAHTAEAAAAMEASKKVTETWQEPLTKGGLPKELLGGPLAGMGTGPNFMKQLTNVSYDPNLQKTFERRADLGTALGGIGKRLSGITTEGVMSGIFGGDYFKLKQEPGTGAPLNKGGAPGVPAGTKPEDAMLTMMGNKGATLQALISKMPTADDIGKSVAKNVKPGEPQRPGGSGQAEPGSPP